MILRFIRWVLGIPSPSREWERAGREIARDQAALAKIARRYHAITITQGRSFDKPSAGTYDQGWVTCTYMKEWDKRYAGVREPERWVDFACPVHKEHAWVTWVFDERVYLGRGAA